MALDRIRRVESKREMESVTDDFVTMGYEVISRGESSIRMRQHGGWGSLGGHLIVGLLTVWWSFGIGNIVYAVYKRYSGEKVLLKLEELDKEA
ncbi:hypothetical protein ACFOLK_14555 [Marinococcus halophilus]|uniref:DUF8108 domain-containing protein n=1 Tax=Marinococcus halophilus TaxID=1371 RepID=A0A510Y6V7_MARHA|nr:hypothetical protein [Marinococcus halophilus]GEK59092.1 hypothetical protein MHA01_19970 [Marinococcus halophilus]